MDETSFDDKERESIRLVHKDVIWGSIGEYSECSVRLAAAMDVMTDEQLAKFADDYRDDDAGQDDIEHCDRCCGALEEGRIGYCDGCTEETGRRGEYDDGDEEKEDA